MSSTLSTNTYKCCCSVGRFVWADDILQIQLVHTLTCPAALLYVDRLPWLPTVSQHEDTTRSSCIHQLFVCGVAGVHCIVLLEAVNQAAALAAAAPHHTIVNSAWYRSVLQELLFPVHSFVGHCCFRTGNKVFLSDV
jgi:hypothetical protein